MNQYTRINIESIAAAEMVMEAADNRAGQFRTSLGALLAVAGFLTPLVILISIERNARQLRIDRKA